VKNGVITKAQLKRVEERYWETMVPDAAAVVAALHFLNKHVFVISGGLAAPVRGFARRLGIAPERVRAVELKFNELSGAWWRYHDSAQLANQKFMDYYDGRPHWGKLHYQDATTFAPRYPEWDTFASWRSKLDPAGTFRNSYLDRVLGTP